MRSWRKVSLLVLLCLAILASQRWAVLANPVAVARLQTDILVGLVDYWKSDETSGDLLGAHAHPGKTFTEVGTVGSNAGKVYPTAREYSGPGTTDKQVRDNDDVRFADIDFTVAVWWYQYTTPDGETSLYHYIVHQDGYDGGYTIGLNNGNQLFFMSGRGEGVTDIIHSSSAIPAPNGTWHFAVCWYTASDHVLHMVIDNGTEETLIGGARAKGTNSVKVGGDELTANTMDGRIGPLMMWNRALTSAERSYLWNNNAGLTYDGMLSGSTATPTSTPTQTVTPTNTPTATRPPITSVYLPLVLRQPTQVAGAPPTMKSAPTTTASGPQRVLNSRVEADRAWRWR